MNYLMPQTTVDLFRCFEESAEEWVTQAGHQVQGILSLTLNASLKSLVGSSGWFHRVGETTSVSVPFGEDFSEEDLHYDPAKRHYFYTCPETLFKIAVDESDVAILSLDCDRLLSSLADLLDIPNRERDELNSPKADGHLWRLGSARLSDGFHYPIWFCRGAQSHLTTLDGTLRQLSNRDRGLILTAHQTFPMHYRLPAGFYCLSIAQALHTYGNGSTINRKRLYQAVVHPGQNQKDSPVFYDNISKELVIAGKEPWLLQGENQPAAVEYLYKQALAGHWEVKASDILLAVKRANHKPQTWTVKRLPELFNGKGWEHYLTSTRRGYYGFNLT
ncbi:hypothetical protein [Endozoicomonas ascidiicola]|uniref:hypothetical protein n=1 Tax=Endozoicomonas ascidiicola TaxID=1698521 RepID=UPI00082D524D|nr:hypothetical protein [Endozoicomonas ascidiicola]